MKKFFIAAVMLLMCYQAFGQLVITQKKAEPIEKPRSSSINYVDLRPYTMNGFLICSGDYSGDYTSICTMELRADPETVKNTGRKKISDPAYLVNPITAQELINEAVEFAKKMGADGIINLNIAAVEYTGGGEILVDPPIMYYILTGLCISRAPASDD